MTFLAALAIASTCALVEPAPTPDPAAAATYLEVAESELSAGANDTALVAFREALRLDPENARAKEAIAKLCEEAATEPERDPFEEGVELLDDGEPAEALKKFEEAAKVAPDAGVALMRGICRYELDDDVGAQPLLLEAEKDPATAKQARMFLGLIALRNGDRAEAASRFASAGGGADPRLSTAAGDLLKLSRRDGRVVVGLALDTRFDTNVALAPDGTPTDTQTADGAAVATVNVFGRPLGYGRGLYLNASGLYRRQFTLHDDDFGGAGGTVGWEWLAPKLTAAVEYGVEDYALAGSQYLFAHRVLGSVHGAIGRLWLGAAYRGRLERFGGDYRDYSGLRHATTLDASWRFEEGSSVSFSWRGEKDFTRDETLAYGETGPWLQGQWRATQDLRIGLQIGAMARHFLRHREPPPGEDPTGASGSTPPPPREDAWFQGDAYGEYDLGEHLVLRASVGAHHTDSNDSTATYSNVYGSLGIAWVEGFF